MLVELCLADAYGYGFEYSRPDFVRKYNNLSGYVQHPKHKIKPGNYTDDGQMSIALAELIIEGNQWNEDNIANKFVEVFKRDERLGYAGGFYNLLMEVQDGQELSLRLKGRNKSDKSGAAMRALPLGFISGISEVLSKSEVQAKVTHDTIDGIHAAQAASLMSYYFIHEVGPRKEIGKWINKYVPGQWATPYTDSVGSKGWMSVRAAITAITKCTSLSEVLRTSIAFTGDVDTVAALAVGAASMCKESFGMFGDDMIYDIPEHLILGLENGKYGRNFLESLEVKLKSAVS